MTGGRYTADRQSKFNDVDYKKLRVGWIVSVPFNWSTTPFFAVMKTISRRNGINNGLPMLSVSGYRGVEIKVYEDENRKRTADELENYLLVSPNDLVVNSMWLNNRGLGVSKFEGTVSPAYKVYEISKDYYLSYADYLFRSDIYVAEYTRLSKGVRPNSLQISTDDFRTITALIPPLPEQQAIAAFLDRETARLDALIARKERLLELLEEKRKAIISRAVTRGLDASVPMKDSGVEWLGQVPEGWAVMPLKSLARMSGGGTPTKDRLDFWDGNIPWVSPKDMKVDRISSSEDHIMQLGLQSSATSMVPSGSLLVVFRSGILRHTLPVAINEVPVSLNQDMKAVRFLKIVPVEVDYYFWLLSGCGDDLLPIISKMGATVESIDSALFMELMVPVPPIPEQQAIAAHLDTQTAKLDALRLKLELSVQKLREYRTSLISAAVTGKIDVRGAVADGNSQPNEVFT